MGISKIVSKASIELKKPIAKPNRIMKDVSSNRNADKLRVFLDKLTSKEKKALLALLTTDRDEEIQEHDEDRTETFEEPE